MNKQNKRIAVMGAGFGGLSVAYHLKKQGFQNISVYEAANFVGGLARSFEWHGIQCDLAPHRLFTNDQLLLGEMLELVACHAVKRNSRICLSSKWIADPVNAIELMLALPKKQALTIATSYLLAMVKRRSAGDSFHSFVEAKFGKGLNEAFFQPYAEKLFGIPSTEVSVSWGESKVRVSGLKDMIRRNTKLYFDQFYYPDKGGYGSFVQALQSEVADMIHLEHKLVELKVDHVPESRYTAHFETPTGVHQQNFDVVINTIPVSRLVNALGEPCHLRYRGAKLVYLLINKQQVMKQHWAYFVDREYPINRLAEFQNFNLAEHRQSDKTVLCAEVTDVQQRSDSELVAAVVDQLVGLDMFESSNVIDHKIITINHAYPIYDLAYVSEKQRIDELTQALPHFFSIGRQAEFMHQDIDEIFASAKRVAQAI